MSESTSHWKENSIHQHFPINENTLVYFPGGKILQIKLVDPEVCNECEKLKEENGGSFMLAKWFNPINTPELSMSLPSINKIIY